MIDIGLGDGNGEVLLFPVSCWHILLELHHLFETHLLEFFGVLENNCCHNVQTQIRVVGIVREIGVVEPESYLRCELSKQQAGHPLEIHMVEVYVLLQEMFN